MSFPKGREKKSGLWGNFTVSGEKGSRLFYKKGSLIVPKIYRGFSSLYREKKKFSCYIYISKEETLFIKVWGENF